MSILELVCKRQSFSDYPFFRDIAVVLTVVLEATMKRFGKATSYREDHNALAWKRMCLRYFNVDGKLEQYLESRSIDLQCISDEKERRAIACFLIGRQFVSFQKTRKSDETPTECARIFATTHAIVKNLS